MREVLFVSKPVTPPWNDSSKNLVRDLASHLRRHTPIVMGRQGQARPFEQGRVEEIYGSVPSRDFALGPREKLAVTRRLITGSSADLWHFFFAPNPISSTAGRIARALRRVPSVQTVCSLPAAGSSTSHLEFADITVVLSHAAYDRFRRDGVPQKGLRLIPPCVPLLPEPMESERAKLRARHGIPVDAPVWIYPGDLEFGRGARIVLGGFKAWDRREAILLMACRRKTPEADTALARLREQAERWNLGTRVRWVGETPHIHELLALSDFVVMVDDHGYAKMDFPLAALESMSLGRAVLLGAGTPAAELAEDGAAVAVSPNPQALAEAVEALSGDRGKLAELGRNARQRVASRFSPRKVTASYELLYEELLA